MAFFRVMFVFITLSSVALTLSSALLVDRAVLAGVLYCTNSCSTTAGTFTPLANVPVDVVCANGSVVTVLRSGLTNVSGVYQFVFNFLDTVSFDQRRCSIVARLPTGSCSVNPPTGILTAPLVITSIVDSLLGNAAVIVAGPPSCVA